MPGGVCAVLDYDVEMMADYIAEMTVRVISPHGTVVPGFRKFVSQILTSTRLPSTTILLGMNYLAKRINIMNATTPINMTEGQMWRTLTVALLLGSKFLDDNTFQNRSWAEVSGIPVAELNTLEYEWLRATNWGLYVNLDKSADYQAWLKNWKDWLEVKKRQQAQSTRERLASLSPIQTEIVRTHNRHASWVQQQQAEYERYASMKRAEVAAQQQAYRVRDAAWQQPTFNNLWSAPLTPPETAYAPTPPEYHSPNSGVARYTDWCLMTMAQANYARGYQQSSNHSYGRGNSAGYHAYQPHHYGPNAWETNVAECNCVNCSGSVHAKPPHFMTHSYGQTVMG